MAGDVSVSCRRSVFLVNLRCPFSEITSLGVAVTSLGVAVTSWDVVEVGVAVSSTSHMCRGMSDINLRDLKEELLLNL